MSRYTVWETIEDDRTERCCGHKHRGLKAATKCARSIAQGWVSGPESMFSNMRAIGADIVDLDTGALVVKVRSGVVTSSHGRTVSMRTKVKEVVTQNVS